MLRKLIAFILVWSIPGAAIAGPLKEAAEKGGRDISRAQAQGEGRSRGRLWTSIGLLAGGALMTTLGAVEIGDDETGPDDGEDLDDSDDGEDSDVNKALVGGGIAAAALGGVLLFTGRDSGPRVSLRKNGFVVKQTVRF